MSPWINKIQQFWEIFSFKVQLTWGWFMFQCINNPSISHFFQYWKTLPHKIEAETFDHYLTLVPSPCLEWKLLECQDPVEHSFHWKKANHPEDQSIYYLGNPSPRVGSPFFAIPPCFLSIYYVCENSETFLDLTPSFYMSGSQILSKEFIRWWLEYNYTGNFVFNNSYQVFLTDTYLTEFTIGWEEYICLDAKNHPLPYSKKRV